MPQKPRDKLRPDGPLSSSAETTNVTFYVIHNQQDQDDMVEVVISVEQKIF